MHRLGLHLFFTIIFVSNLFAIEKSTNIENKIKAKNKAKEINIKKIDLITAEDFQKQTELTISIKSSSSMS